MKDRQKYMYKYYHDCGEYLGCRAEDNYSDCYYQKELNVDCRHCHRSKRIELDKWISKNVFESEKTND